MVFDKGKQLLKMRQQAKALQKELKQIKHSEEKNGIKVKVNGEQKLEYLVIDGEERSDILDLVNKAGKEVQKKAAKKMMEMGGGLGSLFGN